MSKLIPCAAAAAVSVVPAVAQAHGLHGLEAGLASGLLHPLLGADHLLAALALGVWAGQSGGRATWALPAGFVSAMAAGAALAAAGLTLPLAEPMIIASLLALGLLAALALRLPLAVGLGLAAVMALAHGYAHASDAAAGLAYGLGLGLATALLHGAGIALAVFGRRSWVARTAGLAAVGAGLVAAVG